MKWLKYPANTPNNLLGYGQLVLFEDAEIPNFAYYEKGKWYWDDDRKKKISKEDVEEIEYFMDIQEMKIPKRRRKWFIPTCPVPLGVK